MAVDRVEQVCHLEAVQGAVVRVVEGDVTAPLVGSVVGDEGGAGRQVHLDGLLREGVRVDSAVVVVVGAQAEHVDRHLLAVLAEQAGHGAAWVLKEETRGEVLLTGGGQISGHPLLQADRPADLEHVHAGALRPLVDVQGGVGHVQAAEGGVDGVKVLLVRGAHRQNFPSLEAFTDVLRKEEWKRRGLEVGSPS